MKSVLISIQPKWVEKIASGEKTIEVRKSRPKLETPFKCYIYCSYGNARENYCVGKRDKVIGHFTCDRIDEYLQCLTYGKALYPSFGIGEIIDTRLSLTELNNYGKGKPLYGWHISDLKIYDKPKELGEFKRWNRTEENSPCTHTKWLFPDCKDCKACNLERPPQSWCYVEV